AGSHSTNSSSVSRPRSQNTYERAPSMSLERLWAGWRGTYVSGLTPAGQPGECVFCRIVATDDDEAALVLERTEHTIAIMNLYPYGSGHLMVAPLRHVGSIEDLRDDETTALAFAQQRAVRAI